MFAKELVVFGRYLRFAKQIDAKKWWNTIKFLSTKLANLWASYLNNIKGEATNWPKLAIRERNHIKWWNFSYFPSFDGFNNKPKSVWSNAFWYVKVCIFWKCIQYTIHWDKTQMLEKFPLEKINCVKNALFFCRELQLITALLLIFDS